MIDNLIFAATDPPQDMQALMWVIITTLCGVVAFGGRVIFASLKECKEDRKELFAENESDRKEFYREVKSLQDDKLKLTRQVAFVAGKCGVNLEEAESEQEAP